MTDGLAAEHVRVLGCLVEKERTTPDQYPLSTNALVLACNQRTNREPVVDYDDRVVDAALLDLRLAGLARTVRPSGSRAHKHRHVLDEAWGLDSEELAVLAVLMLRGPQTPGELRARTDRYIVFTEMAEVEAVLAGLARRERPLVANLGRRAGQSQDRGAHTLADPAAAAASGARAGAAGIPLTGSTSAARPVDGSRQPEDGRSPVAAAAEAPAGTPAGAASQAPARPTSAPTTLPTPAGRDAADLARRVEQLEAALVRLATELGVPLDDLGLPASPSTARDAR